MIRWVWAFVDRPAAGFEEAARFWAAATGASVSERRGQDGEFATLLPPGGADPCVKVQGVREGAGGAHVCLAVEDVAALVARAVSCGAAVVAEHSSHTVLSSPAGQPFCAVPWKGETTRPEESGGIRLDQVCIDVPPDAYEAETEFWAGLTEWRVVPGQRSEFRTVRPNAPDEVPAPPVHLLLQRLDTPGPIGAHLDFACGGARAAARTAHERLGASFVEEFRGWTVMRDPAGGLYCLTDRDPRTGS
ncbi:VOC family protein [Phaeacidiphilus oryzae]|uniref:VOC family protein n=1 Tax=Phaeacidiphilus oryzae TaxID=348818 RepID=UPI000562E6EC|nr:VOC family protein [Phaeacidiphilus oryzae]